jgi:hypothetical protein
VATSVQRRAPVILSVIPPGTTHKTGGDQADGTADLTSENDTRCYPMDGAEATHNRSVAGSRPASPTQTPRSTAWVDCFACSVVSILSRPCTCWAASGSPAAPPAATSSPAPAPRPAANAGPPGVAVRSAIWTGPCEPGPAHPGRDRRAHHRGAADGVLRGHGRGRPGWWAGDSRAVAAWHRGPGVGDGGVGAGGQAPWASGGAAAVVAAAGRLGRPVHPAPGRRGPAHPGRLPDRRGDPGVAAGQLRRAESAVPC